MAQKRTASVPVKKSQPIRSTGSTSITKQFTKVIWEDGLILACSILAFIFFFITAIYIVITAGDLPPQLAFFYSLPWGEQQLIPWAFFITSPVLIPVFFVVYFGLALKFYNRYSVLLRLLFFSLFVLSMLMTITIIKIILLYR